jgi:predicted permease
MMLGIKGVLGAALIIGISTPSAVNSAVIAQEFNNEPEFAAQVVFMTTVFCTVTLPPIIAFVTSYFRVA